MNHPSIPSRLSRRRLLQLAAAGAAATVPAWAAACAPSGSGGATSEGGGDGPLTLRSWYFAQEPNNQVFRAAMSQFEERGGRPVDAVGGSYDEYLNQAVLEGRSQRLTGVIHLDFSWVPAIAALGVLATLDDVVADAGYSEAGLRLGRHADHLVGLPLTTATISMVANTQLLERAGVSELPATADAFVDALDRVKALDGDLVPYALGTLASDAKDYIMWMWQFGSTVMDGDTPTLGDEPSVAALTWCKELLDAGYVAPDVRRADARALFANERAAFYEDAIVARTNAVELSGDPGFGDRVSPVPRPGLAPGDRPRALLWGNVMGVIDDGDTDAAVELARYLTTDGEVTQGLFDGLGLPPSTEEGLAVVADDVYTTAWTEQITAHADMSPFSAYEQVLQLEGILGEAIQRVFFGGVPAAESLGQAAAEIEATIA